MITISIQFLAGKFHATPWGRHVNEGVPEWPPSPWRILRSLIATWKTKCPSITHESAAHILQQLAGLPVFTLPPATSSHTRHYMPWDKNYAGHTTLVFDTFVSVAPNEKIIVSWPDAKLTPEECGILSDWLSHVGYLGRAESWCEMKLLTETEVTSGINCRPLDKSNPEREKEIVRVLCPDPETAFFSTVTPKTTVTSGKGKAAVKTEIPHYDPDWHICGETLWLHAEKWAEPPGSRWIRYTRDKDCFKISPKRKPKNANFVRPQVVRFALDSNVLPLVTQTLRIAEEMRRNLMGIHGRMTERRYGEKGKSAIFSGKDDAGLQIKSHGHAYYLPTDENDDGRLDHVTLIAEDGFGPDEMAAIYALREIKTTERKESGHPLGVLLLGTTMLEGVNAHGPIAGSAGWNFVTPYLCHRHPKTRGSKKDTAAELSSPLAFTEARLREDISRLLARRPDLADITMDQVTIKPLAEDGVFRFGKRRHRPIEFQRFRQKHGDDGGKRLCGAFTIHFPRVIRGPVVLGHSCHYGMGLCLPILD